MRTVLAVLAALAAVLAGGGCAGPERTVSESSLRNATARGAAERLRSLGYPVKNGMRCRTLPDRILSVVRVRCSGRTTRGEPVRVDAVARDATTARPRQQFVITVGGRQVVRAPCLGRDCR